MRSRSNFDDDSAHPVQHLQLFSLCTLQKRSHSQDFWMVTGSQQLSSVVMRSWTILDGHRVPAIEQCSHAVMDDFWMVTGSQQLSSVVMRSWMLYSAVLGQRSKHICGLNTFLGPHQRAQEANSDRIPQLILTVFAPPRTYC